MSRRYVLYDHGALVIVDCRAELGFAGVEPSAGLFVVDAWRLSEGIGGEFGRGSKAWQQHVPLPGCEIVYAAPPTLLAEFDAASGLFGVEDAAGSAGDIARYVGMEYEEARWRALDPTSTASRSLPTSAARAASRRPASRWPASRMRSWRDSSVTT
jgi:hypothetical protein